MASDELHAAMAAQTPPDRTPDAQPLTELAERFKLASNPTRAHLLLLLGDGEQSFDTLQSEIACWMSTLSRHLAVLRMGGLVESRKDSQRHVYALTDAGRDLWRVVVRVAAVAAPARPVE